MMYTNNCKVDKGKKLTKDGYLRVTVGSRTDGSRRQVLKHRLVWEQSYGDIPEGYEVNHLCKNRACYNVEHLELLTASEHRVKDNSERYASRLQAAKQYWIATRCSGTELAKQFNVSQSTGYKWIRKFK